MRKFYIILFCAVAVRVLYVYIEPMFNYPDESAHWNYISHIHDNMEIPDFAVPYYHSVDMESSYWYENYQPPGYYVVGALVSFGNPYIMRWMNILMFVAALCLVWKATEDVAVCCLMSFLPGFIAVTTVISNDVFLLLGSALLFYGSYNRSRFWTAVLGGLVLATAKAQGLAILVVVSSIYLYKRQWYAGMVMSVLAILSGMIYLWRLPLQKIVDHTMIVVKPTILNLVSIVATTLAKGAVYMRLDEVGGTTVVFAGCLGILVLWWAIRRFQQVYVTRKMVIGAVMLVWLVFSLTHIHWSGRLLYAAVPWLAIRKT